MPMVIFREYRPEDRTWVTTANLRHYRITEGFNVDFVDAVVEALDLLEMQFDDHRKNFMIAEAEGRPIGCIFLSAESESAGRIRLFYLDELHRGRGIGKRMLTRVVESAQATGFETVRVSTFERHHEACRLYASLGFQSKTNEPTEAFGQQMRQVDFELNLADYFR